jgi:hypothetical protein
MAIAGAKPKPQGQSRTRHKPVHEWTEVVDVPFVGAPKLPPNRLGGKPWPRLTRGWWKAISTMPHCKLWNSGDWQFALDAALVAADFHDGNVRSATELRNREKVLGTTVDYRRDLRIRYVPVPEVGSAEVASLDDFRARY